MPRHVAAPSQAHPVLASVFDDLDRRAVTWCVLRDADQLQAPAGDVDLLVARPDLAAVEDALAGRGFLPVVRAGQGSHRHFVTLHEPDGLWLKVDLVSRLEFGAVGELRSDLAADVLARRHRTGAVAVPSGEDEFWLLFLHGLLDKPDWAPRHVRRLQALAPTVSMSGAVAAWLGRLLPEGWDLPRLTAAVSHGEWDALRTLEPSLRGSWRREAGGFPGLTAQGRRWLRRSSRLGAVRRRGLVVALLAPDGAGKSTLIDALQQSIRLPVRTLYLGLFSRERPVPESGIPGVGTLVRLLRQWRTYVTAARHRRAGAVVLCDRYCYDALVGGRPNESWLRQQRRRLLGHATPAPDLAVLLDAPGEVLRRRKPEHDADELERRRQDYRTLARRCGWHVIDASQDLETVKREVAALIWRVYQEQAVPP